MVLMGVEKVEGLKMSAPVVGDAISYGGARRDSQHSSQRKGVRSLTLLGVAGQRAGMGSWYWVGSMISIGVE
jgi:hypothetical protein